MTRGQADNLCVLCPDGADHVTQVCRAALSLPPKAATRYAQQRSTMERNCSATSGGPCDRLDAADDR
eukprot:5903947-Prymnesium_polylepis.1